MTPAFQQLRVTVIGAPGFVPELEASVSKTTAPLSFDVTTPDTLDEPLADIDCLVLDQETIDNSVQPVLNRVANTSPSLPVVLLVTDTSQSTIQDGIEACVTDYLPRSLCESNPSITTTQLVSIVRDSPTDVKSDEWFVDGVDAAVSVLDPLTGEFSRVNHRMAELLDTTQSDIMGKSIDDLRVSTTETSSATVQDVLTRILETGQPETHELVFHPDTGVSRVLDTTIRQIPDADQNRIVFTGQPATSQKKELQAPPQSDRQLELVTENVEEIIYIANADFSNVEYVNSAYEDMWGRPVGELYEDATAFMSGIDPRDRESFEAEFEAMRTDIKTGDPDQSYEFEFRVRQPDGEVRWAHATGYHVTNKTGEDRYVGIVEDITERRDQQQRLEAERDRRSIMFENTSDPIMAVTFQNKEPYITEVNSAFESTFGYDAEQISDRPISDVVVPDAEWSGYERIRQQALAGESVETEVRRKTTDEIRDFLLRVLPFESVEGRHAYVWYTDITERKRRERAIEEERKKYTTLVEQSTDGVAVVSDGKYVFINEAFADITGYDRSELLERPFHEVFTPESRELVIDRYERRVAGESPPNQYDVEIEARNSEPVTLELSVSRIQHEGEPATLANFRDITERRRRERTIEQLQTTIERLQAAETSDDVYSIAVETTHDVLGLPIAACWRQDGDAEQLTRVAGTDPAEKMWENSSSVTPGDWEYSMFERGEATTYDPTQYHEHSPLDAAIIVPIGDQALLAAGRAETTEYKSYLIGVLQILASHAASALERVARSRELRESQRRLQAIVDRIDGVIFFAPASELDEPDPDPEFVSAGYDKIWGQSLETIVETYDEGFFETLHSEDYDRYRDFISQISNDVASGDAKQRYTQTFRIKRPEGEIRWVHSDFYVMDWTEETPRVLIVSRDITERKQRERTLESFHDATAELTTADAVPDACHIAVTAAADIFDMPATAVYHYNEETATLVPTATGPEIPSHEELEQLTADSATVWESFISEQMQHFDSTAESLSGIGPTDEGLLLPLGGNGVLAIWLSDDSLDTDSATILAATLEASLNRLRGERELKSRRAELEAQSEHARRLESITELTQRIEAAITTRSSREGIRDAVCAELVNVDPFSAAWIAGAKVGTDQLTLRTVVRLDRDEVEQFLTDDGSDGTDTNPVAEAWESGDLCAINELIGGRQRSDWQQYLLKQGAGSFCAVPLEYAGVTYGVLAIVADAPEAFGERERDVLAQLGTSIGYAMTAIRRQRALESDDTLELEFQGTQMDLPFAQLADEIGCRVRQERTIRRRDDSVSVYYTLVGEVTADVVQTASTVLPGDIDVVSRQDSETVIEQRSSSWFGAIVSEYGGVLQRCQATGTTVTLAIELPQETDTRSIVDRIQKEFPELDLTAQRHHHESESTPGEVRNQLQHRLSERQYEALETAYAMGYFEWPRESSGENVAKQLNITQPTVNKHIRLGEAKVFDFLFGSDRD